jgi:hypothetical protein
MIQTLSLVETASLMVQEMLRFWDGQAPCAAVTPVTTGRVWANPDATVRNRPPAQAAMITGRLVCSISSVGWFLCLPASFASVMTNNTRTHFLLKEERAPRWPRRRSGPVPGRKDVRKR